MPRPTLGYRPPVPDARPRRNWTLIVSNMCVLALMTGVLAMLACNGSISVGGVLPALSTVGVLATSSLAYEFLYEHPRRLRRARAAFRQDRIP